jgi:hypothetical protein
MFRLSSIHMLCARVRNLMPSHLAENSIYVSIQRHLRHALHFNSGIARRLRMTVRKYSPYRSSIVSIGITPEAAAGPGAVGK